MESKSLLQSFGIAKNGSIASVTEVERGLACGCTCPSCHLPLIAKQGDVRVWHFAHTPGTDCEHGAESALHHAAKAVLERAGGLQIPGVEIRQTYRHPDGRYGEGNACQDARWIALDNLQVEVRLDVPGHAEHIQPDVMGYSDGRLFLIEVAVTHFVDFDKYLKLKALNLPALEIDLSAWHRETWDWDALEAAIIGDVANKQWLVFPEREKLQAEALQLAREKALAQPLPTAAPPHKTPAPRERYRVDGRSVMIRRYPFGTTLWAPYDATFNEVIKGWARRLGGKWQPSYRNWLFPKGATDRLVSAIESHEPHR